MYKLSFSSSGRTLINIEKCTSECRETITLNLPSDFISLVGCIKEDLISKFSFDIIKFEISVGFTEPYNSLFSVLSFFISKVLFCILSDISLAIFFF